MFDTKTIQVTHERPLVATPELQEKLQRAAQYRLDRVSQMLQQTECDAVLMYDPVNIRYATDSSNMQVWTMHNFERYAMVFADGYTILWDFTHCEHLTEGNQQIDEVRTAISWSFFSAGERMPERAEIWAAEIDDVLRTRTGGNAKLAVDVNLHEGAALLQNRHHTLVDGESLLGKAR